MMSSPMREGKVKRHRATEQRRRERIREAYVRLRHIMQMEATATSLHILEAAIRTIHHYARLAHASEETCRSVLKLSSDKDITSLVKEMLVQLQQQLAPGGSGHIHAQTVSAAVTAKRSSRHISAITAVAPSLVPSALPFNVTANATTTKIPAVHNSAQTAPSTPKKTTLSRPPITPKNRLKGPDRESKYPEKASRPSQVFQQTLNSQRKRLRSRLLSPSAHLKPYKAFSPSPKGRNVNRTEHAKKEQVFQTFAQRLASLTKSTINPSSKPRHHFSGVKSSDAIMTRPQHVPFSFTAAPTNAYMPSGNDPLTEKVKEQRRPTLYSPSKTLSSSSILGLKYGAAASNLSSSLLIKGASGSMNRNTSIRHPQPALLELSHSNKENYLHRAHKQRIHMEGYTNPFQSYSDGSLPVDAHHQHSFLRQRPSLILPSTTNSIGRHRSFLASTNSMNAFSSSSAASTTAILGTEPVTTMPSLKSPESPALDIPMHVLFPQETGNSQADSLHSVSPNASPDTDPDPYAGVLDLPFDMDFAPLRSLRAHPVSKTSMFTGIPTHDPQHEFVPLGNDTHVNPLTDYNFNDTLADLIDFDRLPDATLEQAMSFMDQTAALTTDNETTADGVSSLKNVNGGTDRDVLATLFDTFPTSSAVGSSQTAFYLQYNDQQSTHGDMSSLAGDDAAMSCDPDDFFTF